VLHRDLRRVSCITGCPRRPARSGLGTPAPSSSRLPRTTGISWLPSQLRADASLTTKSPGGQPRPGAPRHHHHGTGRPVEPYGRIRRHDTLRQRAVFRRRRAVHFTTLLQLSPHRPLPAADHLVLSTRRSHKFVAALCQRHDAGIWRALCSRGRVPAGLGRHQGLSSLSEESAPDRTRHRIRRPACIETDLDDRTGLEQ